MHKIRGAKGVTIGWFESHSENEILSPPTNPSSRLVENDFYVHWIEPLPRRCQVWLWRKGQNGLHAWLRVHWGQEVEDRHIVITGGGMPSLVAGSTWQKTYKNMGSQIITPDR